MRKSLLIAVALSSTASVLIGAQANAAFAQTPDSGEVTVSEQDLWQGFKFGMKPDEIVKQLLSRNDIRKAKYKVKKGVIEFDITYAESGIKIFDESFRLDFETDEYSLAGVRLTSKWRGCYSYEEKFYVKFYTAIREKYGNVLLEDDGGRLLVASNDQVRVTLALVEHKMPSLPLPPRQNPALANTTDWNYLFAKGNYDRIVKEREDRLYQCQSDLGRMASIVVIYQDEADQKKKDALKAQRREQKKANEVEDFEKESEKL